MATSRVITTKDSVTHHVTFYSVRDQIGHFVRPRSAKGHPCLHLCCRGRQVHPDALPVKLDRSFLRGLSDDELERELHA
jgi:hypothetical protein